MQTEKAGIFPGPRSSTVRPGKAVLQPDAAPKSVGPEAAQAHHRSSGPIRPLKKLTRSAGERCFWRHKMKDYCVELKVCEGCGALFLRAASEGTGAAGRTPHGRSVGAGRTRTCQGCSQRLSEFPVQRERRRRGFELPRVRRCAGTVNGTAAGTAAVAGGTR